MHGRWSLIGVEDRHQKAPTVITSQCPIKNWHHIIGEPTVADAILDRLLHHCYKIELKGESIQKDQKMKSTDLQVSKALGYEKNLQRRCAPIPLGRFAPESPAGLVRNRWPTSAEYAFGKPLSSSTRLADRITALS